jgi:NitT/TauT family transport system ATP-binding protein
MTDRVVHSDGIQIDELSVRFPTPGGEPVTAVDRVSQRIPEGGFVSVVGPSGCGKSTLLGVIAGLQRATSGTVTVDGRVVTGPDRRVGLVFQ